MLRKLVVQDLGWENWSRIASKQWLLSNLIIHLCLRKFYGLFARTKSWSHFYQCWLLKRKSRNHIFSLHLKYRILARQISWAFVQCVFHFAQQIALVQVLQLKAAQGIILMIVLQPFSLHWLGLEVYPFLQLFYQFDLLSSSILKMIGSCLLQYYQIDFWNCCLSRKISLICQLLAWVLQARRINSLLFSYFSLQLLG